MIAAGMVAGLVIGRLTAPSSTDSPADKLAGPESRATRSSGRATDSRSAASTVFGRMQQEIRNASPDQLSGILYRALESADPNERTLLVAQCLNAMDASNWRKCLDQFATITRETGRTHKDEWEACLFRAGQVGGEDALNMFKQAGLNNQEVQSWSGLYGWATSDPAAATKWLAQLEESDPGQWHRLMPALAAGAALKDPDEGVRLLESLPENERRNCVGHFTWNIVQSGGVDRAVDWMKEVVQHQEGSATPFSSAVANEVMNKVVDTSGGAAGIPDLANRLERINSFMKLDDERLLRTIVKLGGPTSGLDLLARLSGGPVLQDQADSSMLVSAAISATLQRDPTKLAAWFEANPKAPFLQAAADEACNQLQARGMTGEAEKIRNALPQ